MTIQEQDTSLISISDISRNTSRRGKKIILGILSKSKIDDFHFFCKVCQKDYVGGLTEIQRHENSSKHEKNCTSLKNQKSILPVIATHDNIDSKTKKAEIRIAAFVTEHNLPFAICDHLPNLIKYIGTDSKVVENLNCGRTKCTGIVNNVIGRISHKELVDLMRTNYFSLLIDESTDKGCTKHLALVVRIKIKRKIQDCFFTLLPIVNATANAIFSLIVDAMHKENIPYKINLVGFAADGANVMMGNKNSVSTLLKEEIPHIFNVIILNVFVTPLRCVRQMRAISFQITLKH